MIKKGAVWALLVILISGCGSGREEDFSSPNFTLQKLGEGVYACINKFGGEAICNAGIIDNGKETIIFDTFLSPDVAEEVVELVEKLGLSPISYVVNSHAHNDHVRGNQVFGENIPIIGTSRTAELIEQWESEGIPQEKEYAPALFAQWDSLYRVNRNDPSSRETMRIKMWRSYYRVLAESHLKVRTRIPDLIMEDSLELNGPDRRVVLLTRGTGHTESDVILHLPEDQILFTADLVFYEMHPYLGHGDPDSWLKYLDYMESLDFTTLVPGHGEVCGRDGIANMRSYISDLISLSEELVADQVPMDSLSTIPVPDRYTHWWFERFFTANLHYMFGYVTESNLTNI